MLLFRRSHGHRPARRERRGGGGGARPAAIAAMFASLRAAHMDRESSSNETQKFKKNTGESVDKAFAAFMSED